MSDFYGGLLVAAFCFGLTCGILLVTSFIRVDEVDDEF